MEPRTKTCGPLMLKIWPIPRSEIRVEDPLVSLHPKRGPPFFHHGPGNAIDSPALLIKCSLGSLRGMLVWISFFSHGVCFPGSQARERREKHGPKVAKLAIIARASRILCSTLDGRNPAPPKQSWNDDPPVYVKQTVVPHGFNLVQDFVHPQYCGGLAISLLAHPLRRMHAFCGVLCGAFHQIRFNGSSQPGPSAQLAPSPPRPASCAGEPILSRLL